MKGSRTVESDVTPWVRDGGDDGFCQQEHKVDKCRREETGANRGHTCKAKSCLMRWKEASHG